jgi:osmotically-inducible protein OsmY
VHPKGIWPTTETDIAKEVERALAGATNIPATIKAEVKEHTVTLVGEVAWNYQRRAAVRAVQYLRGVFYVLNDITLTPRPTAADAEQHIRRALKRNALVDAKNINIAVEGNHATLSGHVSSWAEKEEAGRAAWSSPNVTDIENRILVRG